MKRDTIGEMGALCRKKHDKWAQHSGKRSTREHSHMQVWYGMVWYGDRSMVVVRRYTNITTKSA
jgi:hypothetical protein